MVFAFPRLSLLVVVITVAYSESQTLHCQQDDVGCQRCSASCNAINPSYLPECCEAFNTCCDAYLASCKQCSAIASVDKFFPEYCCASFTACCDQVTTIKVSPTTKRPPKPEPHFNIGENTIPSIKSSSGGHGLRSRNRGAEQSAGIFTQQLQQPQFFAAPEISSQPRGRGRGSKRQRTSTVPQTQSIASQQVSQRRRTSSRGRVVQK